MKSTINRQLIARLKREIQSLKEELAMLTGEQRDGQLTVEEIQSQGLLADPDPDVMLSLDQTLRKIQFCFSLLKMMIMDKQRGGNGKASPTAAERKDSQQSAAEVTKLKEMMTHRDNEISIL
ncbi:hypothetical protein KUCAC02_025578 [Chaenocephalus aceratus]|uniref:Uncharacterized protein n=1 Tax=Chaenocephalus aceratus TaxID=36190 RepID=A0ACB9VVR6_CHAAC|nr:hypothetical protein KUCAC02_025578 [Chaenocephalus aceratus]